MNCREFLDFLMDYLEGELPRAQVLTFESHMGDCPQCVTYLDTYRETVRLGKEVLCPPDGSIPDEAPADLVDSILAARRAGAQPPEK
jgi:anti-sigma factor RsiW